MGMGGTDADPGPEGSCYRSDYGGYWSQEEQRRLRKHAGRLLDGQLKRVCDEDDILQETYLAALEAGERIPSDPVKRRAYLRTTATNEITDRRRQAASKKSWSNARRRGFHDYRYRTGKYSADDFVRSVESEELLEVALSGFSVDERTLLEGFFGGVRLAALARSRRITTSAAKKRVIAALKRAVENITRRGAG